MPEKQEPRSFVDVETGELFNLKSVNTIVTGFAKLWLAPMYSLSKVKGWTPTETRLFFALVSTMDAWNVAETRIGELAKDLELHQPAVSAALAGLIEKGLVMRCDWRGKTFNVMVNPRYLCRVSDDRQKDLVKMFDELALDPRNGGPGEEPPNWEAPGVKEVFDGTQRLKSRRKEDKYGKEAAESVKSKRRKSA
jgi:predicted transcriptional regulator